MINPYNPAFVLINMVLGSLNGALSIMAAGENTAEMVYNGAAAALNLAILLYVRNTLNKHQQKEVGGELA